MKHLKHCDLPLEEEPLIVPPVWNKSDSQATISQVWKTAYRELSNAINIYVIGYSIPPSDQFFKHLLALSLAQGPILDRVVALNPEQQAYDRLKSLMSETVQAKAGFIPARFDGGSEQIARHLGITLANKPEGWEQN